jgi:hypothetical protein
LTVDGLRDAERGLFAVGVVRFDHVVLLPLGVVMGYFINPQRQPVKRFCIKKCVRL